VRLVGYRPLTSVRLKPAALEVVAAVLWIHSRCSLALSRSHMQVAAGAAARKAN
jgi:hypothetical protein